MIRRLIQWQWFSVALLLFLLWSPRLSIIHVSFTHYWDRIRYRTDMNSSLFCGHWLDSTVIIIPPSLASCSSSRSSPLDIDTHFRFIDYLLLTIGFLHKCPKTIVFIIAQRLIICVLLIGRHYCQFQKYSSFVCVSPFVCVCLSVQHFVLITFDVPRASLVWARPFQSSDFSIFRITCSTLWFFFLSNYFWPKTLSSNRSTPIKDGRWLKAIPSRRPRRG